MGIEKSKNKKIIMLLVTIVSIFLIQAIYLIYFELFKSDELNNNSLNMRSSVDESLINRGTIFDRNGLKLAYSEKIDNEYKRIYTYNYLYSSIIGYNTSRYGKSAIELSQNNELLGVNKAGDIFSKIDNVLDSSNKGNDLYLTIDDNLQSYIYDLFGENKGAVIVSNPKNGKILAMLSKPSFNVNRFELDFEEINQSDDGILLNRATNGMYEPGSIFKVLTSMVFLKNGVDLNYNDLGEATIADYTVKNYNNKSYGNINLEKALQVSSNTYFFEKSKDVTNKMFLDMLKDFGIGQKYPIGIGRNDSIFPFKNGLSDLEKGNAAFGQGKTYVTPIDMLQIAMGIANDGVVYQPYIIDKIVRETGTQLTNPKVLSDKINPEHAKIIREYLLSTAKYNGYNLSNGKNLAGKTGTAETADKYNSWYLGMAPAEDPQYTIVLVVENTDKLAGEIAATMAIKIMDYIFNNSIQNN